MNRSEILAEAARLIETDRAATYGDARAMHGLIAAYWSAHLDHQISAHDVAIMMTLLKLARARVNPGNADSWVDAAAYAALGGELAQ